jgi:hypothetical protein
MIDDDDDDDRSLLRVRKLGIKAKHLADHYSSYCNSYSFQHVSENKKLVVIACMIINQIREEFHTNIYSTLLYYVVTIQYKKKHKKDFFET